jgi:phosphoenolpyruvate-protein kinase (PTS system EI component)
MGLREFSMQPAALLNIREQLNALDIAPLERACATLFGQPLLDNPLEQFERLTSVH